MKSRLVGLPLVLLLWALPARGQSVASSGSERDSLAGLSAVSIVVIGPSPEAERDGLTGESIRTDVELRLRRAGIYVPIKASETTLPKPSLYITADTWRGNGMYAIALRVQLQQLMNSLVTGKPFFGSTWERAGIVTVGAKNLQDARGTLGDYIDQFVNDFRAANPSRRR